MSSVTDRYVVVVGIDFSDPSIQALDQALEAACTREGAELHVVYVEPEVWPGPLVEPQIAAPVNGDMMLKHVHRLVNERLNAAGDRLDKSRLKRVVSHFLRGAPAENIAQLAAEQNADLVVVGSHGHRGILRLLLGSVAERVARLARCPVWIVRPKAHTTEGGVPEIEPPCPECVRRRQETVGETQWCARHSEHPIRPHRYSYRPNEMYAAESTAYASTPEGV
jgi:nucleotide-binding universal stress UspA family protein